VAHPRTSAADRAGSPSGLAGCFAPVCHPRGPSPSAITNGDFLKERIMSNSQRKTTRTRKGSRAQSPIPEPFQIIRASTIGKQTTKVPMLVLRGEWLKAIGFPINAGAYLTTDRRGEMTLHRLGLGLPRRLRIVAAKKD
jgi:hypothetical protein